jgi:predicted RNase H-like HicB family nuclease
VTYYVGILDVGANGAWGVRIPDVPGCHGGGGTPEAAIADAIGALREVAEHQAAKGFALRAPRAVLEVLKDKEAGYDAKRGETFVMVPLVLDQARSVKANISLDAGLLEAIDDAARVRGLTRSGFLASAARDKIIDAKSSSAKPRPTGKAREKKASQRLRKRVG